MMEVVVKNGAIRRAKLQSKWHHQQINIQFFIGGMPFLSPKNTVKALKGKTKKSIWKKIAHVLQKRPNLHMGSKQC